MKILSTISLAIATLFIPLYLWRPVYPVTDWALLFLAVLAFLLFAGVFAPTASKYRAWLSVEVRETSPLFKLLTGRVHAGFYAAIPKYASFHYSVLGEYTELTQAAMGQMSEAMSEKLFAGFEERLQGASSQLDQRYVIAYQNALQAEVANAIPADALKVPLGPITLAVVQNAETRLITTVPLASIATIAAGSGALKAATTTIATKIAARVAAKAAAKGLVKGGGILAGAGGRAPLCSWTGPGAAVCGVAGGVAAWLITDSVIVNLDEYFNRDEFEAELRELIDEDRAEKKRLLEAALEKKASEMDAAVKDFTLRDLGDTGAAN